MMDRSSGVLFSGFLSSRHAVGWRLQDGFAPLICRPCIGMGIKRRIFLGCAGQQKNQISCRQKKKSFRSFSTIPHIIPFLNTFQALRCTICPHPLQHERLCNPNPASNLISPFPFTVMQIRVDSGPAPDGVPAGGAGVKIGGCVSIRHGPGRAGGGGPQPNPHST